MTGMEDYLRMGVLSGCDSEHKIKDGRKSKRSVGPVPCLYLSLPRQMVVILHLKISRAASHSALGQHASPLQSRNSSWYLSGNPFSIALVCLPLSGPQRRWGRHSVIITLLIPGSGIKSTISLLGGLNLNSINSIFHPVHLFFFSLSTPSWILSTFSKWVLKIGGWNLSPHSN